MSAGTMAKRTLKKNPAKTPAPPAPKAIVLTVKDSPQWRDWLNRGADFLRLSTATMVDLAVIEFLKRNGFKEPPPKR
jgi:hypothetical protein